MDSPDPVLPAELLGEVISHLTNPDLHAAALSSRQLHHFAARTLYTTIVLPRSSTHIFQIALLVDTLFRSPYHARLVTVLDLDWHPEPHDSDDSDCDSDDSENVKSANGFNAPLHRRPAECTSLRTLRIRGPPPLLDLLTALRLIELSPLIETFALLTPRAPLHTTSPLRNNFHSLRTVELANDSAPLEAVLKFRSAMAGTGLAIHTIVVHHTPVVPVPGTAAAGGFGVGGLVSLLRRIARLRSMRCVRILDKTAVGWIGFAIEASVRIPHVRNVVLAECDIARKMDLTQAETLRRLVVDIGEVFPYIEELELVCEEGELGHDHALLKDEVERARVFDEMKPLILDRAPRSLRKLIVCEHLVVRRASAEDDFVICDDVS